MPFLSRSHPRAAARRLRAAVLFCTVAVLAACAGNAAPAGPYPGFAEFDGDEVTAVRFEGLEGAVSRDSLEAVVSTRPTRCGSPLGICPFGWWRQRGELDLGVLSRDVIRIQLVYRDAGYYGTRVTPRVEPTGDDQVRVTFAIAPGDLVTLRELTVEGAEAILTDTARMRRRIPLEVGEPFRRRDFTASADTVRAMLLRRGYVYAQVLRNYSIDTVADVAEVQFVAAPGPLVRVDSVLIAGTYRLDEETVRRQLTFDEGDVLRLADLNQSQLNLFQLELVDFASVEIAPDSLQLSPDTLALERDSIGSTVLVRVVEAARYQMETALGYGTQDCLRGEITRVDRNFLGGARRLELSAAVSKVGVGDPLHLEERTVCRELDPERMDRPTREDSLTALSLNYRVSANFLQPQFFGTRSSVVAAAQAERVTEVGLYLRESVSGQLGLVRRVAPRTVLTATLNAERGRTEASPFYLCLALDVCEPDELEFVTEPRWNNFVNVAVVHNRIRGGVQPVGGYSVRGAVDLASELIGSDDRYARAVAEGAIYRQVRPGWTLAGRLLAGSFLPGLRDDDGYIPPEQRFYAGGPNTVRGYYRNQLGPQVYVAPADTMEAEGYDEGELRNSATGGTRTVVASVELHTPSPFLRDRLRLAAFMDAGQVWDARGCGDREREGVVVAGTRCNLGLRFTPGVGLRVGTPVGPIRLDVAVNPYGREPGPLYIYDPDTGVLDPTPRRFRETDRNFFDYLTVHIAVGNAF